MGKSLFFVLILLGFFTACTSNQNEQSASEMFAAFNRHDWSAMASYYSDRAEFLDPSFGLDYVTRSREETATKYSKMAGTFPDISDSIKSIYSTGDNVVIEFVSSGSSGDSIKFKLPICSILTFKNGKIIRDATYYDQ
jgi:ketosteroid isomerase-like protein